MPLPVSAPIASDSYAELRSATHTTMQFVPAFTLPVSGDFGAAMLNLLDSAKKTLAQFALIDADPVLAASVLALYAKETGDTIDTTAANVTACAAALQAVAAAIMADFPKAADGKHIAWQTFDATGAVVSDPLVPANFPTTQAAAAAWLATVS
jgi:hypothetical protein